MWTWLKQSKRGCGGARCSVLGSIPGSGVRYINRLLAGTGMKVHFLVPEEHTMQKAPDGLQEPVVPSLHSRLEPHLGGLEWRWQGGMRGADRVSQHRASLFLLSGAPVLPEVEFQGAQYPAQEGGSTLLRSLLGLHVSALIMGCGEGRQGQSPRPGMKPARIQANGTEEQRAGRCTHLGGGRGLAFCELGVTFERNE